MRPFAPLVALLVLASFLPAAGQTALPMGDMTDVRLPADGGAAELRFEASGPGFLTVVVRSTGGEDLRVSVTDDEYQLLTGAEADMDVGGDVGAEQLVVSLPGAGPYRVLVETLGSGGAAIRVGGSFLPADIAASPPDPDGRPSGAVTLAVGASHEDRWDPSAGDTGDWYRIVVERDGVLTVITRSDGDGDLVLEVFEQGSYRLPLDRSDRDHGGVLANESITADVRAGTSIYVRVGPASKSGSAVEYRLTSGLIPG